MLAEELREPRTASFVGLANYVHYFSTPALSASIVNSLTIALISTAITVPAGLRLRLRADPQRMPAKGLFKTIALVPILVPSLLPGIALVYLFGNQGLIKGLLFGHEIYGPIGIVIAEVFFTFPHALIIILTALAHLRRAALRGGGGAARARRRGSSHRHPARRALRADQRRLRGVHPGHHRLRRAEGDRRAVQRARHRRLQAGHRPAELRDGRGGRAWSCWSPRRFAFVVDRLCRSGRWRCCRRARCR